MKATLAVVLEYTHQGMPVQSCLWAAQSLQHPWSILSAFSVADTGPAWTGEVGVLSALGVQTEVNSPASLCMGSCFFLLSEQIGTNL